MRTVLDSSVILDVLTDDARWADTSEAALKKSQSLGQLVVGECVLAEIIPALPDGEWRRFLTDWKILFLPSTVESAAMAGEMYRVYLRRARAGKRVLPDFLIGAHALHYAGRLLARDRGYYRDYFSDLQIIEPKQE